MSTQKEIDYLDGEITIIDTVPSTIDELVELIGSDAVLDESISNLYYRNKYPRVYKSTSKQIESELKKAVKETKKNKDGTLKEIFESPNDHLRRYLAGEVNDGEPLTGDDLVARRAHLNELFTATSQAEPLYVKGERTGGQGKISGDALANSNKFFALGVEKVEQVAGVVEAQVPGYKVARDADDAVTVESLARGLMALTKHLQKQAQNAMLAAVG